MKSNLDSVKQLALNQNFLTEKRRAEGDSQTRDDKDSRDRWLTRVVIALDTAATTGNEYVIDDPFDAVYVESATDDNVSIKMAFSSREFHQTVNYLTLKKNDSIAFERRVSRSVITWSAQSGKNITLVFLLGAKFQAGSFRQVLSGGVVVTTGSAMTPQAYVDVLVTSTSIFAADTTRNQAIIQNLGSNDIYISGVSTVTIGTGATPGVRVQPGDSFVWNNTGACYGIAAGATARVSVNTEA